MRRALEKSHRSRLAQLGSEQRGGEAVGTGSRVTEESVRAAQLFSCDPETELQQKPSPSLPPLPALQNIPSPRNLHKPAYISCSPWATDRVVVQQFTGSKADYDPIAGTVKFLHTSFLDIISRRSNSDVSQESEFRQTTQLRSRKDSLFFFLTHNQKVY